MLNKNNEKTKRKGKRKMVWMIVLAIVALLGVGQAIFWYLTTREHAQAQSLPIAAINFKELNDGTYIGEYEGGMYKWRVNKVQVEVGSGKVNDIQLLSTSDPAAKLGNFDPAPLYDRVIKAQTLQVDTLSGATLTSKAYLKAIEGALVKAEKK